MSDRFMVIGEFCRTSFFCRPHVCPGLWHELSDVMMQLSGDFEGMKQTCERTEAECGIRASGRNGRL